MRTTTTGLGDKNSTRHLKGFRGIPAFSHNSDVLKGFRGIPAFSHNSDVLKGYSDVLRT